MNERRNQDRRAQPEAHGVQRRPNPARELVAAKRRWHSASPPEPEARKDFPGWRSRGYLPHFDRQGLYQFVTFRLADALPAERRNEWEALLAIADERERLIRIEAYLDRGYGVCHLKEPRIADLVQNALLHFDGARYELFAWVVMPNHVHALVSVQEVPLARILHSWKAFTALEANRLLGREGRFWQVEYFDRYMRDLGHFKRALRYIENHPVKAGLVRQPEDWLWSSARYADPRSDRSAGVQPARTLAAIRQPAAPAAAQGGGARAG